MRFFRRPVPLPFWQTHRGRPRTAAEAISMTCQYLAASSGSIQRLAAKKAEHLYLRYRG